MLSGKIAFTNSSVLHILNLADGSITAINEGGRTAFPSWHPSGQQIASGVSRITVFDLETNNLVQTSREGLVANYPAWHPSGGMLAFDVKMPNDDGFYFQEFESQVEFSLPLPFPALQVDWHPNGREIVFVGVVEGNKHIFKLDMSCIQTQDCPQQVQQLTTVGRFNHAPSWSADGTTIAFEHYLSAENRWVIMLMDADGSNLRRLSDANGNDHHPTWGHDNWLAFERHTPQGRYLCAVRADGSDLQQLTQDAFEPAWWYPR
jgi:Tol biopolymer transport system component